MKKYVKILNIFAGPVCEAKLEGLREGQAYEWQVRAVNKASINQEVTKRCRLSWLTNIAPPYMSPKSGGGREGVSGSQPMSTAVHNAHGAQINFGDLTLLLTYGINVVPGKLSTKRVQ
jgi:hypothetical protein